MRTLGLVVVLMVLSLATVDAYAGDVAIIVHKENALHDVTFTDLTRLLKQERRFWGDGQRVYLVLREAGSSEKKVVLQAVYKMDDNALKKFWLGKLYRGDIPRYPKTLGSNEAVKRFIGQVPNAVGFIDVSFVDDNVKVLRIDGKLPGDLGYALSGRF